MLSHMKQVLVEYVEVTQKCLRILMKCNVMVPARTIAILTDKMDLDTTHTDWLYEIQSNPQLNDEHQNLILLSVIDMVECGQMIKYHL